MRGSGVFLFFRRGAVHAVVMVLPRRDAVSFFENMVEVAQTVKPEHIGDLQSGKVRLR